MKENVFSLDLSAYDGSWVRREEDGCWALENVVTCAHALRPDLQSINLYVPLAYRRGGSVGGWDAATAPIVLRNCVGGYSECSPEPLDDFGRECLAAGLVYVTAGARGKQTTDGDTAQVGAELAEFLGIPHLANVTKLMELVEGKKLDVEAEIPLHVVDVRMSLPCLLTVEKGIFEPRLPSFRRKLATADQKITCLTLDDLPDRDENHYGLNGSPTQVQKIFPPEVKTEKEVWTGSSDELSGKLYGFLNEKRFLSELR